MIDDLVEFVAVLFGIVISMAGAIFFVMALWAWLIGPQMCSTLGDGVGLRTEYKFWYGCFVTMPDGRVLPERVVISIFEKEYKVEIKK